MKILKFSKNGARFNVRPAPRSLTVAIALVLAAGIAPQVAQAFQFGDTNGLSGTVNTTVSYGISYRVSDVNEDLIAKAHWDPTIAFKTPLQQRAAKGAFSANGDDGDLNYGKWQPFSNQVRFLTEVKLNYGPDWGAFIRAGGFYDFTNANNDNLTSLAKDRVGKDIYLLDAFIFHNFELNAHQGSIRLGSQVASWGESTFIQGGINVINPIDVSKLRSAGADLKEAYLPINMLRLSYNFTDNFSAEAVYLLQFSQTNPDPSGTYFSTNDFASIGGTYASLPFGLLPQPVKNPENYYKVCNGGAPSDNSAFGGGTVKNNPLLAASCSQTAPRTFDQYPNRFGQFGLSMHYVAPWLNNTEFGFYYLNYDSRLPFASGYAVTSQAATSALLFNEYPSNIHLFGASFNTTLEATGVALQGEVSYRPNMPLQISAVELIFAGLSPLNAFIPQPGDRFNSQLGNFAPGQLLTGYTRRHVAQIQSTATKVFGPGNWFNANQIAVVGEIGATDVTNMPARGILRLQGDGTDTSGGPDELSGALRNPETQVDGFPTKFSWGYRLAARADYNNAFGSSFTLSPRVAFNHDVHGISPGPGGNFIQGRKSITLGMEANYLNQWSVDLSYTNYFGAGVLNLINDRDFVAFVVKYAF